MGTDGQPKLIILKMNRLKFVSILLIGVFTFVFLGCNKDVVREDESNLSLEKVLTLKFGLNVKQLSETSYKIGDENTSFIYTLISKDKATIKNSFNNQIEVEYVKESDFPFLITYENGSISQNSTSLRDFIINNQNFGTELETRKETFKECFVREWKDFCDNWSSCIAQAVHPVAVAAAIAIHCS